MFSNTLVIGFPNNIMEKKQHSDARITMPNTIATTIHIFRDDF